MWKKISMSLSRRNTKAYRDFLGQRGDPCGDLHESSFGCFLWVEHWLDTQRHLLSLLAPPKKKHVLSRSYWKASGRFQKNFPENNIYQRSLQLELAFADDDP